MNGPLLDFGAPLRMPPLGHVPHELVISEAHFRNCLDMFDVPVLETFKMRYFIEISKGYHHELFYD